jgi:two-component system cell cycle response regulator DivK
MEDNAQQARLMKRLLEHSGYRILVAPDGQSGLQLALDEKPDLILLDLGLPDLDGQTVVGLLRGLPDLADVPIVAVTAWPQDTAAQMAKAYGCDGYFSKPISAREFPAQLAAYFEPEP